MSSRRCSRAIAVQTVVLVGTLAVGSPLATAAGQSAGLRSPAGQTLVSHREPVLARAATSVRATSILGSAWKHDNTPIPFARLRLRNLVTARIDATTVANESGQFEFQAIDAGSYVIELVSEEGKVLAVGHTFAVESGETLATFVRLGSQVPWFTGFFGNAALAVSAAAATAGLTALAPEQVRPVSGRQ